MPTSDGQTPWQGHRRPRSASGRREDVPGPAARGQDHVPCVPSGESPGRAELQRAEADRGHQGWGRGRDRQGRGVSSG